MHRALQGRKGYLAKYPVECGSPDAPIMRHDCFVLRSWDMAHIMTRINMDCTIHATRLLARDAAVRSSALKLAALILFTPVLHSGINASF